MQNARERIRRIAYDQKKTPAQKRQEIEYWMMKNIRWAQEALGREPKIEVPERPIGKTVQRNRGLRKEHHASIREKGLANREWAKSVPLRLLLGRRRQERFVA